MTDAPPLPPPIRPLGVPPYYLLNEQPKTFERLTRALLAADPSLARVDMFGVGGQSQYGVDVVGHAAMGPGRTVASCKCVRTATRANLKTWSKDFLHYRDDEWRDVGRFILATSATNITDTKLLDQREAEAQRFAQHGVEYIVWGPDQLTDAIAMASASVARQFLGQAWEEALHPRDRGELTASQAAQLTRLQSLVSQQASARLGLATELMRSGQYGGASAVVADLRQPQAWDQLSEPVQAQALRLEGSLADAAGDSRTAGKLAEQALALDRTERRLSALLRAKADGALAGLEVLGDAVRRSDRQLEVAFLLEADHLPEASEKLETLLAEDLDDSESQRLAAHLCLIENRRADALVAARLAHELAPSRLSTGRTLAMACYAAALSPITPAEQTTLPNPCDPDLIRTDAAGLVLMGEARDLFRRLAARSLSASGEHVWLLACLANLPDQEEAAGELCRDLLRGERTSVAAIAWGLARDLTFDRRTSQKALQILYDSGEADENQVQALVHLIAADDGADGIRGALEPALHLQPPEPAAAARLVLDALAGNPEPDAENAPSLAQAIGRAQDHDDWSQVATCLDGLLGGSSPTPQGLGLARFCAQKARWALLATHVEALVRFETAGALELAALVLHHAGTPEAVLALLEAKADLLPAAGASLAVRRVEIVARYALGQLPKALQLAEQLAAETSEMDDRLRAADIHLAAGHTQAALPAIRAAANAESLKSDYAVRYSIAVTRDDPVLATRLWRQAMERGVSDDMLLHALSQGYKLGLDAETGPLFPRLQARALSGAGDVWMIDLDQVVQQMLAHRDRSEDLSEQLAAGALPVHLVARALNLSVAELYWFKPRFAAKGAVSPLFIRHGGRPPGHHPKLPWSEWRLYLDLTGLLIADQLDLWTHLDDLQTAVTISRALPDALIKLEHDAAHHQKTQVKAAKAITDARLTGRLTARGGGLGGAHTVGHDRDEPEADHADFTVAAVIAAARGEAAAQGFPSLSGRLSFTEGSIHALAMTEDFDAVIDTFACDVDEADFEAAAEELRRAEARETLADWIEEVKKRVADRLEDGRFSFPAAVSRGRAAEADGAIVTNESDGEVGSNADERERHPRDFIEESLLELLAADGDEHCALWVDDRLLNGYQVAEGKIVVGVTDVLDVLAAESRITAEARRRALLNLRRAGSVFIPLDAAEVLASLTTAQTVANKLIETADLATYRRNLAAASRLDAQLKLGPSSIEALRDRPDEVSFMLDSRKVAGELLIALWNDPAISDEEARARSDWVWASLRLEQPLRVLPGGDEAALLLASLAIAALIARAPHLGDGWSDSVAEARRQAFAAWLNETAIEPREGPGADRFLDLIADQIAALVDRADVESLARSLGVEPAQAERILLPHRQRLFDLMPEPIQLRLVRNTAFATAAGLGSVDLVTVNGVTFAAESLWSASAEALRNGTASVQTEDGTPVEVIEQNGGLAFRGGLAARVRERFFPALKAEGEARVLATNAFLAELDLAPDEAEAADRSIAAAKSDGDLVSSFQRAQDASVVYRYARLSDFIRDRSGVSAEMLAPPKAAHLLHHLRLTGREGSIADAAPHAWADLTAKLGVRHAFRRLGGLPLNLCF